MYDRTFVQLCWYDDAYIYLLLTRYIPVTSRLTRRFQYAFVKKACNDRDVCVHHCDTVKLKYTSWYVYSVELVYRGCARCIRWLLVQPAVSIWDGSFCFDTKCYDLVSDRRSRITCPLMSEKRLRCSQLGTVQVTAFPQWNLLYCCIPG